MLIKIQLYYRIYYFIKKKYKIFIILGENGLIVKNVVKEIWKIKGLSIVVLEPFVRLRILFNGLLLNVGSVKKGIVEHVQFNFM